MTFFTQQQQQSPNNPEFYALYTDILWLLLGRYIYSDLLGPLILSKSSMDKNISKLNILYTKCIPPAWMQGIENLRYDHFQNTTYCSKNCSK
jgi:hypothetical protein